MVKRKGGFNKGQALHLSEFLGDAAPLTPVAPPTYSAKSSTDLSRPDPVSIETPQSVNVSSLPSAPRAQREGSFDPSKVPRNPPFTAFVGNLPFDSDDEDIVKMFAKNTVKEVRLLKDKDTGHFKGYGYVEFQTAEDLIAALKMNEVVIRNRAIKVDVATGKDNRERGEADTVDKWERGRSNEDGERKPYVDTTSDDWRRDVRPPQDDAEPVPYQRAPRRYDDDKEASPRRYGNREEERDTFSRDDFGTKINEAPKESFRSARRDEHDDRGSEDRGPWRPREDRPREDKPRDEPRSESPWVKQGDIRDAEESSRERPRLNIKPRTVATEEKPLAPLKSVNKPNPFGGAKPVDVVERERPEGRELRPEGRELRPEGRELAKEEHDREESETEQKPKLNPFGSARPADTANWRSARAQGTGPIKTPTAQKIENDDGSDELISESNKFMLLNEVESVE